MKKNLSNLIKRYYETNRNEEVFNEIFSYCSGIVNSAVSSYTYKEDMQQEAAIKIFILLEEHDLDKVIGEEDKNVLGYIKKAIINHLRSLYKKDYKFLMKETTSISNELENMCAVLDTYAERGDSLENALEILIAKLTKTQKMVMKLLYLDQLSETEVAECCCVKRQNINKIKNRAKKAIKANLTLQNSGDVQTPIFKAILA